MISKQKAFSYKIIILLMVFSNRKKFSNQALCPNQEEDVYLRAKTSDINFLHKKKNDKISLCLINKN